MYSYKLVDLGTSSIPSNTYDNARCKLLSELQTPLHQCEIQDIFMFYGKHCKTKDEAELFLFNYWFKGYYSFSLAVTYGDQEETLVLFSYKTL